MGLGIVIVGLLLVIGIGLARHTVFPLAAQFLNVAEPPTKVDSVLVLNGDPETRPFVAAAIYQAGLTPQILVTTASPTPASEDGLILPEHEIIKQVLHHRGVPTQAIHILPGEISSTIDEARVLAKFLDAHPNQTVAIVTNRFHTRRARWVFRRVLGDRSAQLHFVGAPKDDFREHDWWQTEQGTSTYLSEYLKFAYYVLRY